MDSVTLSQLESEIANLESDVMDLYSEMINDSERGNIEREVA